MNKLKIPNRIVAGDSITWIDENLRGVDPLSGKLVDYTSDLYKLSWSIRGPSILNAIAIPEGQGFKTTLTKNQTYALAQGKYFWQAYIENIPTDLIIEIGRLTIGMGQLDIVPSLNVSDAPFDGRTTAQRMLDAINEAILARQSGGAVQEYSIKGRSLKYAPINELISLRNQLKMEVTRENAADKIAQGLGDPRRLFVRFK